MGNRAVSEADATIAKRSQMQAKSLEEAAHGPKHTPVESIAADKQPAAPVAAPAAKPKALGEFVTYGPKRVVPVKAAAVHPAPAAGADGGADAKRGGAGGKHAAPQQQQGGFLRSLSAIFGSAFKTLPQWRKAVAIAKFKARLTISVMRAFESNADVHPAYDYVQTLMATVSERMAHRRDDFIKYAVHHWHHLLLRQARGRRSPSC